MVIQPPPPNLLSPQNEPLKMMMMMNCFCGMVDRRKVFSLISRRDHSQRSSPSRISNTPRAGFKPAQNLSSVLVSWMKLCSSDNHYTKKPTQSKLKPFHVTSVFKWYRKRPVARSSRPDVFCKKVVLKNFTIFTGKHLN